MISQKFWNCFSQDYLLEKFISGENPFSHLKHLPFLRPLTHHISFQATLSGISFSTYISDGWNKLDCAAVGLYVAGFILRSVSSAEFAEQYMKGTITQMQGFILTDNKFGVARVFFAISLFLFYVRLMYIFSFHIALGPKLIMIGKMVRSSRKDQEEKGAFWG